MVNQYCYLSEKITTDVSDDYLMELIKNEMEANRIETYAYLRLTKNGQGVNLISTYPKKWLEIYFKNKYYYSDPVVKKSKI
ncbi:autoinducer binding domain-containing protein [Brenneria populi subsp. brevivirga]|uniref:autoinducer binding domain-containing protein n=1 Tax=Brenneria populi TaxID=1505588 RepID=UPI002E17C263|nr:autoinducer binding domain-containing protein [Brenneria populi subsp. brevivirga]